MTVRGAALGQARCLLGWALLCSGLGWVVGGATAQDAGQTISTLVKNETDATARRGRYFYVSEERSDRTGGHLWKERVAETNWGKVKYLVEEDGQPLSGSRLSAEKARVEGEARDPEGFKRQEDARGDDEQHAKQMLTLLPKAFLFEGPTGDGDTLKVGFRPNPAYSPQSLEERVLHGMSGTVLIDRATIRLKGLEGRIAQDVSIGFGLLATIKAGSNFSTLREPVGGIDWKTETIHTDINGKALFLKTIARKQDSKHWGFKRLPEGITMADAVKMVESGE